MKSTVAPRSCAIRQYHRGSSPRRPPLVYLGCLVLFLLVPAFAPAPASLSNGWTRETVDLSVALPRRLPEHALALDVADQAHLVYAGNRVYYARQIANGWQREIIDSPSGPGVVGFAGASLALDLNGTPHVAYTAISPGPAGSRTGQLRYAVRLASGWSVGVVYQAGVDVERVSLGLAGDGSAHISFFDVSAHALKYARQTTTGWTLETVDTAAAPQSSLLATDGAVNPKIAYTRASDGQLIYAYRAPTGEWLHELVPGAVAEQGVSLSYSDDISFVRRGTGRLAYAIRSSSAGWSVQDVPARATGETSLRGAPFVQIFAGNVYASLVGTGWITKTVTVGAGVPLGGSLAQTYLAEPRVAFVQMYFDSYLLFYATPTLIDSFYDFVDQEKTFDFLDPRGLRVGSDARPQVAYGGQVAAGLGHTYYSSRGPAGWSRYRYSPAWCVPTLALDAANIAYTGYHDCRTSYALNTEGVSRYILPLQNTPSPAPGRLWESSLELTAEGVLYLSYTEFHPAGGGSESGVIGMWSQYNWITRTLSPGTQKGPLALDAAGLPHVAYPGRYLSYDGNGWVEEAMPAGAGSGTSGWSLALDAADDPHLSYYSLADRSLHYLVRVNAAWHDEVVESGVSGAGAGRSSIAVDPSGRVHISYYDETAGSIKYARKSAAGWAITTVVSSGPVALGAAYNSLALDPAGAPYIAYIDRQFGDLTVVHLAGFARLYLPLLAR